MFMLSFNSQRRHLRRTAVLTLLAWVFALLAGVVNACQLQPYAPGTLTPVSASKNESGARAMHAGQPAHSEHADREALAGHERQSDTGNAGCLKFCDEGSTTVTPAKTAPADLVDLPAVAGIDWAAAAPDSVCAPWRRVEQPVCQGPPLFIRFLRLTI